jgi:hypothetical protein
MMGNATERMQGETQGILETTEGKGGVTKRKVEQLKG